MPTAVAKQGFGLLRGVDDWRFGALSIDILLIWWLGYQGKNKGLAVWLFFPFKSSLVNFYVFQVELLDQIYYYLINCECTINESSVRICNTPKLVIRRWL